MNKKSIKKDLINEQIKDYDLKNGSSFNATQKSLIKKEAITPYGTGVIVDIDLPLSKCWRIGVLITYKTKNHLLIEQEKPLYFHSNEISILGEDEYVDTLRL